MDPPIGPLPLKLAASLEQDDSYHDVLKQAITILKTPV